MIVRLGGGAILYVECNRGVSQPGFPGPKKNPGQGTSNQLETSMVSSL